MGSVDNDRLELKALIKIINEYGLDPEETKKSIIFHTNKAIEKALCWYITTLQRYLKQK